MGTNNNLFSKILYPTVLKMNNNQHIAQNYTDPYLNKGNLPSSQSSVITKAATNVPSVAYSNKNVPTLMESLMNPVNVIIPGQSDAPVLTNVVYVGGLCSDTTNEFIINMLQRCGRINHFKRHTDPSSGLLASFAFCDFESPGGAFYAIETLNNLTYKADKKIKISCNSNVRAHIEDWRIKKLDELRKLNPELSDDEIVKIIEDVKVGLVKEFNELINLHQIELPTNESEDKNDSDDKKVPTTASSSNTTTTTTTASTTTTSVRPSSSSSTATTTIRPSSPSKRNTVSDLLTYTSRDYMIHHKESHRRSKVKSKKRNYDDRFKYEEPEWMKEEEKLLRRLNKLGTVKQSLREELINNDLNGIITKSNMKYRDEERKLDLLDEKEEEEELKLLEIKKTIPLINTTQNNVEQPKKKSINIFSNLDEPDEDPIFKKKHKPLYKIKTDEEIWKLVPEYENDIFNYKLNWDLLFSTNMTIMLLEPWIKKCIKEYMGDEDTLINDVIEFIINRLKEQPTHSELLFDVEQFLDDESKGFILQLWKLLIFQNIKLLDE